MGEEEEMAKERIPSVPAERRKWKLEIAERPPFDSL